MKKLSIDVDAKADSGEKEQAVVSPGTLANNPFVRRDSSGSADERPQVGSPKRGSSGGLANNPFMRRDSKG